MSDGKGMRLRRRLKILQNLIILQQQLLPKIRSLNLQTIRNPRYKIPQIPQHNKLPLPTSVSLTLITIKRIKHEPNLYHVLKSLELVTIGVGLDLAVGRGDVGFD